MSEWSESRIGDLGAVITGSTPPAKHPEWFGDSLPFITPTDITGERHASVARAISAVGAAKLATRRVPPGSVCFVCIGATIGKVCLTETDAFTNQQINSIVPGERSDGMFLYYLLRHEAARIASYAGGAATPILNKSDFSAIVVRTPDLATQTSIARVLGAIDDLIENNRRRVAVLEEMARTVYREWFVRCRYPGSEAALFVDSTLGPKPQDWEICRLEEAYSFRDGKPLKKEERQGGNTPVYGANGIIGFTDREPLEQPCTVMGKIGSCGSLHRSPTPCWVTNNAFRVLPGRWLSPYSVWMGLHELSFRPLVGGAANPYLPLKNFAHLPVFLPPRSLQARFDSFVSPLFEAIDALTAASHRLDNLRDLLLPRLVTGRIDVSLINLDALTETAVA
jgi:type I restriction enzyme S subunit